MLKQPHSDPSQALHHVSFVTSPLRVVVTQTIDHDCRPASRNWTSTACRGGRAGTATHNTAAELVAPPTKKRSRASTPSRAAHAPRRAAQLQTSDIIPRASPPAYSAGLPATNSLAPRVPSDGLTWRSGPRPWDSTSLQPLPPLPAMLSADRMPQDVEQQRPQPRSARGGRRARRQPSIAPNLN